MLATFLLHGIFIILALSLYSRWVDDEIMLDFCLFSLALELGGLLLANKVLQPTDTVFFLAAGQLYTSLTAFKVSLLFCFDELSSFFSIILILALSACFLFLIEYFEYDADASTILMLSVSLSQCALLYFCAYDLFSLLVGWEVIGMISFFLVQHWAFRLSSFKAGLKVFVISQFGDVFLSAAFTLLLARCNTTELPEILSSLWYLAFEYIAIGPIYLHLNSTVALLLILAATLKAAQWFFYPWLLDAMEAPVPISAQLHSSTLVIVGFYILSRFQQLFDLSGVARFTLVIMGLVTSVGACILGAFQDDGKKLLACSTASQLGYVLVGFGLGLMDEALLLLAFCCINKAIASIWLGVLMRRHSGLSDLRMLGHAQTFSWLERSGLFATFANFTVFPGLFCWHIKGIFMNERVTQLDLMQVWGLGLLQLTWFLSSLYLWIFYFRVFNVAGAFSTSKRGALYHVRGSVDRQISYSFLSIYGLSSKGVAALFRALKPDKPVPLIILWLCLVNLGLSGYVGFFNIALFEFSWNSPTLSNLLAYY